MPLLSSAVQTDAIIFLTFPTHPHRTATFIKTANQQRETMLTTKETFNKPRREGKLSKYFHDLMTMRKMTREETAKSKANERKASQSKLSSILLNISSVLNFSSYFSFPSYYPTCNQPEKIVHKPLCHFLFSASSKLHPFHSEALLLLFSHLSKCQV